MTPYKPKLAQQKYKPRFKQAELRQIARNISSTDTYKSDIDPVEYEWVPDRDLVWLHMQLCPDAEELDLVGPQETYRLAYPMRPFEIGFKAWQKELFAERDLKNHVAAWLDAQIAYFNRSAMAAELNIRRRKKIAYVGR